MEANKKKWIIIGVVCVALAVIIYLISTLASCGGASDKLEIVSEPHLSYRLIGSNYCPTVRVVVKNKTNDTIKVEMTCTVYAKDGSVTTGLKSSYTTLVAGETATLTATTSYSYMWFDFDNSCASFGKVEYKFY